MAATHCNWETGTGCAHDAWRPRADQLPRPLRRGLGRASPSLPGAAVACAAGVVAAATLFA